MTISTGDSILKFGTQDEITVASPSTVSDSAFSTTSDINSWTNDDDSHFAAAILEGHFNTTMPTTGKMQLFTQPLNIADTTKDARPPSSNYFKEFCGDFIIDFGVAADTDFIMIIPFFELPMFKTNQELQFYIYNYNTSQVFDGWSLWIIPLTNGPHG